MNQDMPGRFFNEDKSIVIVCDPNVSLGMLHDFLLQLKGVVAERIMGAQKQDVANAEAFAAQQQKDKEKAEAEKPEAEAAPVEAEAPKE